MRRSARIRGMSAPRLASIVFGVGQKEGLRLDFLWAGLCLVGAAWFMFRGALG
jgi:uncharacterized protein (DUF486 family)